MDISEILKQVDTVAYLRWPMRELHGYSFSFAELQKFADLVAAAEREACAQLPFRAQVGLANEQDIEVRQMIRARK